MADQCIVCLEPLDVEASAAPTPPAPVGAGALAAEELLPTATVNHERLAIEDAETLARETHEKTEKLAGGADHAHHDHVARIEVCGHMLHDECLREWSDKANSCPICRQTFHNVTVYDKIGGKRLFFATRVSRVQDARGTLLTVH